MMHACNFVWCYVSHIIIHCKAPRVTRKAGVKFSDMLTRSQVSLQGCTRKCQWHYNDAIMSAMASQITSLMIVYSTVYSGTDQRKHQSSASLAFVRGSHWSPVNSPRTGPVTRKMFPFDDVIVDLSWKHRLAMWAHKLCNLFRMQCNICFPQSIQPSAVLTRANITLNCIHHCSDLGRT